MPIVDKPLAELFQYGGLNPRPADFDSYWDSSLAEMRAVDPAVELLPNHTLSTQAAECFDLRYTGVGGSRIYAKFLRPRNRKGRAPAVLQFHGYTDSSGGWTDKLNYVSQGICVAAMDCRGQGGLSEDLGATRGNTMQGHVIRGLGDPDPRRLLFRSVFLDAAQLARIVASMPEVDPDRIGAMGGSQGGGLTLACAALEPRIRRAALAFPFLCDYRRVWEMDLAKDAYGELQSFFRKFDPRHERADEIFTKLGYIDCQHLASRIRAKVVMFTGLMDTVCPPSTQFAAYNRITSEKEVVVYPDFGHEMLPGHDDRVFNFIGQL